MKKTRLKGMSLRFINIIMIVIAFIISAVLVVSLYMLTYKYNEMNQSTATYVEWEKSASELESASDYLTEQVRSFVFTGEKEYLDNYFQEAKYIKRRETALEIIKKNMDGTEAYIMLNDAMEKSISLMSKEYEAMKLVAVALEYDLSNYPDEIKNYQLSEEDINLNNNDKVKKAENIVFSEEYKNIKKSISLSVSNCVNQLDIMLKEKLDSSSASLKRIMIYQQAAILVMIIFLFVLFLVLYLQIFIPLKNGAISLMNNEYLSITGVREYKYFANEYNQIRKKVLMNNEKLVYEAEHDKLTGLYNRTGYYSIYRNLNLNELAYILIDVDKFKKVNDEYGHNVGDDVLKKVAETLENVFKSDCYVFRIGGDEFAVLSKGANEKSIITIRQNVRDISFFLQDLNSTVPPVTLSIGVAFGNKNDDTDTLFKKADIALYTTKNNGRNGITFYGDSLIGEEKTVED